MNEIMNRRRALMGAQNKSTPRIPAEYQEVEYIKMEESTSYVDTGLYASSGMCIWIDATYGYINNTYGILTFLLSGLSSSSYKTWEISYRGDHTDNVTFLSYTNRTTGNDVYVPAVLTNRHTYMLDSANNKCAVDSTEETFDFHGVLPVETLKIGINHNNRGAKPYIYGCWYKRDGDPDTYYIIPCYRKADSVNGVYCTESEAFCAASGSTSVGGNV